MRFVSKNPNLRVILESGMPASPLTGQLAKPGVSVKFQDGMADVKDEGLISQMLAHSAFNVDYVSADDLGGKDPYAHTREEMEPVHVLSEMKYGHVEKSVVSKRDVKLSPQMEAMINMRASEIAKAMIPDILKGLADVQKSEKEEKKDGKTLDEVSEVTEKVTGDAPKKMGRPPKKAVEPEKELTESIV